MTEIKAGVPDPPIVGCLLALPLANGGWAPERAMTLEELSVRLAALDPGATLPIESTDLLLLFEAEDQGGQLQNGPLANRQFLDVHAFASAYRCRFHAEDFRHRTARFEKDDVF